MRTYLHARAVIPAIMIAAFLVSPVLPVLAASQPATIVSGNLWVDAQAGNDANNGLSAGSAFRSIQAAARSAGAGTTIHILPGVYRESVVPLADGSASAPITYVAEKGPGTVKVRGSVASSSLAWTRLASNTIGLPSSVNPANVYYANLSGLGLTEPPRYVAQLDAQGEVISRLHPAREPDWQVTSWWKDTEFWWMANGGSSVAACNPITNSDHQCDLPSRSFTQLTDSTSDSAPTGIQPGNLTTLGNITGATLVAMDAQHGSYTYHTTVTADDVAAGRITVADSLNNDGTPALGWGSKYYLENHPALLDQPGEWWFDGRTGYFYLWAPNGANPAQLNIEISRRNTGFDLTGRSYITLNGLTIEFYNQQIFAIANSDARLKAFGNAIKNSTLRYGDQGILLYQYMNSLTPSNYAIDNFLLENSEVAYMDTVGINADYWWSGAPSPDTFNHSGVRNTVFRNNHLHDLGFDSDERAGVGVRMIFPDKVRFIGNQVDHTAHLGLHFYYSLISSTKQWGFSPQEIRLGNILVADNVFDKTCMHARDCGAVKFGGSQRPDTHVFRDVLLTGNVFSNGTGWSYVSGLRGGDSTGDANGLYIDYASGIHAYRNISYNNTGAGFKLSCLWRDGDLILDNNIAANNYLFGFKFTGAGTCDNHNGSINTQVVNNILVNNEAFGIQLESGYNTGNFGNLVIDHNLYYQNGWNTAATQGTPADLRVYAGSSGVKYYRTASDIQAGTPWENNGLEGNPAFANYNPADHNRYDGSWPDFRLTASSTNAIDRGTTSLPTSLSALLSMFTITDAAGGNAFDIGRYESSMSGYPGTGVSFADMPVPGKEWMEPWVVAFYNAGITTGCASDPLSYCPENNVTRAEMAVFLLRARHGRAYSPPAASQFFSDMSVAGKEWMEPWVDEYYREGMTAGCSADPLSFCPEQNVTRAEMAVFLLRAKHGAGYVPPAAGHFFADMPVSGKEWMEAWVDQYYREGFTTGCGGGNFCPEQNVTRAEMAVFIGRAFKLYTP